MMSLAPHLQGSPVSNCGPTESGIDREKQSLAYLSLYWIPYLVQGEYCAGFHPRSVLEVSSLFTDVKIYKKYITVTYRSNTICDLADHSKTLHNSFEFRIKRPK